MSTTGEPETTANGIKKNFVGFSTEDRQWDARFNVQLDDDLESLLNAAKIEFNTGKLKYLLIGGVEIGTRPYQDDYQVRHVHCALIYYNRVSKRSILKAFGIKQGNGYYLVPRDRSKPYSGWREHHTKAFSKVDETKRSLLEMGALPADSGKTSTEFTKRSDEEKKRKTDDVLIDMRRLIENGEAETAWTKYPRTYLQYGEKVKAMIHQQRDKLHSSGDPHIWLYGAAGLGKSALLNYIYPKYYKKNLYNRFFDLYDDTVHSHIMLEDLDHDAVDKLSTNFLKTLCDEAGFPVDQKYKTPQLTRSTILVTSNFTISEIITQSEECNVFGKHQNKLALQRRFWEIEAKELMRKLSLKLLPKYELQKLKKEGNTDPSKLFMGWDYLTDTPTCVPIPQSTELAETIRNIFYSNQN
uniref:Replication protein n=1 Tax=Motacilla cinerea parvo-like hybrid virus TaxID=2794517 RepID=A0A8A4XCG5_9VIRU|nr:MAG: replication protein [Motacilla cinerea parvo-like hybrid virus]